MALLGSISTRYTVKCGRCKTQLSFPAVSRADAEARVRYHKWGLYGPSDDWHCPLCLAGYTGEPMPDVALD